MTIPTGRVGPFPVVAVAHSGELTTVYRCRDSGVDRDVAVKAMRPDLDEPRRREVRRRLRLEADVRAAVAHPAILTLYRVITGRGGPLLVAPWIDGGTLADVAPHPCDLATVLALADDIGDALDHLHRAGWWHGDLGAANVLLATVDDRPRPVLVDFGTAHRAGEPAGREGVIVMTPAVTAPEVWDGGGGPASDRYSLGVLLYLALTGTYPFVGDAPEAWRDQHLRAAVPPPSGHAAGPGPAVDAVLLAALAKHPADRFASGRELAGALRGALVADGLLRPAAAPVPARSALPATVAPDFDRGAVEAAGARLEDFAAGLDERERAALSAMLERVRTQGARATEEVGRLAMQVFGPAQALLALDETGAGRVLAAGAATAAEVAARVGAPEWALGRVLALLATSGVLGCDAEGRYALAPLLSTLYRTHVMLGSDAHPLADAAALWAGLPRWAATGEPAIVMNDAEGSGYASVTSCLGVMFGDDAARLAAHLVAAGDVPAAARLLDVGAGSAVWSVAVLMAAPDATATALDRPLVLDTARRHAEALGVADRLDLLAGDWRDAPLATAAYDVALLANICHLEAGDDVARLLERVAGALKPTGVAVVVDTMPSRVEDDAGALLQSIHLGLRSPRGRIHDYPAYVRWLGAAGMEAREVVPLRTHLVALIAAQKATSPNWPKPLPDL